MSTFRDLWKQHRAAGDSMFTYNGHSYNTLKKGEKMSDWSKILRAGQLDQYNNYINNTNLNANQATGKLMDMSYNYKNQVAGQPVSNIPLEAASVFGTGTDQNGQPISSQPISRAQDIQIEPVPRAQDIQIEPVPLPAQTAPIPFNRSGIRKWIKANLGINPYSLTGDQRRAIRMVANGTADSNDISLYNQIKNTYKLTDGSQWFKNGGMINYYQQGGQAQEDPTQKIVALVQAAQQGDKQAIQALQQVEQAAKQGDKQAMQIMQIVQQIMEQQNQARAAKHGAKLNYLASLRGICPEGSHTEYFKAGGQICRKCIKDAEENAQKAVKKNKMACGGATKAVNTIKAEMGIKAAMDKCGGKAKKKK